MKDRKDLHIVSIRNHVMKWTDQTITPINWLAHVIDQPDHNTRSMYAYAYDHAWMQRPWGSTYCADQKKHAHIRRSQNIHIDQLNSIQSDNADHNIAQTSSDRICRHLDILQDTSKDRKSCSIKDAVLSKIKRHQNHNMTDTSLKHVNDSELDQNQAPIFWCYGSAPSESESW